MNTETPQIEEDELVKIPQRDGWHVYKRNKPPMAIDECGESIRLTNRSFEEINRYVNYKFLALILKKIKENPDRPVTIVEIAGGILSKAAKEALEHPSLKGKIKYINVDFFGITQSPQEGLTVLSEDFSKCSLPDDCADIIISYQALPYISDEKYFESLKQIARILVPGGEACLDLIGSTWRGEREDATFRFGFADRNAGLPEWVHYLDKKGVFIFETFRETQLNGELHTFGGTAPMIHMAKLGADNKIPIISDFSLAFPEIIEAIQQLKK